MRRVLWSSLLLGLLSSACLPYGCGSGELGGTRLLPWTFRTQYAWVDKKEQRTENGREVYVDRDNAAGGEVLNIRLFGFMFNAGEDRRGWNAQEWQHFYNGIRTEPYIALRVLRVDEMDNGDDVEFDSENPATTVTDPVLEVEYSAGSPKLNNGSEYGDELLVYGSRVKAKLTLAGIADEPGPTGWVRGTLEYSVERDGNDPSDAIEGEVTVNFSARVLGERLAECNEGTSLLFQGAACSDIDD